MNFQIKNLFNKFILLLVVYFDKAVANKISKFRRFLVFTLFSYKIIKNNTCLL